MDAVAKKIEIREVSQRKTAYLFIKRVFDIVLSCTAVRFATFLSTIFHVM